MRPSSSLTILVLAVSLSASGPAFADHSEDQHITDEMPYTLRPGEWRVGLWKLERGFDLPGKLGAVQLGSYTMQYFLWATDLKLANISGKATAWEHGPWSATVGAGLVSTRLQQGPEAPSFTILPVEGTLGYRVNDTVTVAGGVQYTHVSVDGTYTPDRDDFLLRGALAVSNAQVPISVEWRWNRVLATVVQARVVAFEEDSAPPARQEFMVVRAHAGKTVRPMAAAIPRAQIDALSPLRSYAVSSDLVWSWSRLNLRAGVSYGNVSLPMVNFVSPRKVFFPNLDVYVRF